VVTQLRRVVSGDITMQEIVVNKTAKQKPARKIASASQHGLSRKSFQLQGPLGVYRTTVNSHRKKSVSENNSESIRVHFLLIE